MLIQSSLSDHRRNSCFYSRAIQDFSDLRKISSGWANLKAKPIRINLGIASRIKGSLKHISVANKSEFFFASWDSIELSITPTQFYSLLGDSLDFQLCVNLASRYLAVKSASTWYRTSVVSRLLKPSKNKGMSHHREIWSHILPKTSGGYARYGSLRSRRFPCGSCQGMIVCKTKPALNTLATTISFNIHKVRHCGRLKKILKRR